MIKSKIESLLFISPKPLSIKKITKILGKNKKEVKKAMEELFQEFNERNEGIQIIKNGLKYQVSTHPQNAELVKEFIKDETTGDLTRPAMETLSIVVYRAPITKAELEQVRGVNCSLILRNLMIRGLVESKEDKKTKLIYYSPTFEFLRYLGVSQVSDLPDFEKLNSDENLNKLLTNEGEKEESAS